MGAGLVATSCMCLVFAVLDMAIARYAEVKNFLEVGLTGDSLTLKLLSCQ